MAKVAALRARDVFEGQRLGGFLSVWEKKADPKNRLLARVLINWPGVANLEKLGEKLQKADIQGLDFSYLLPTPLNTLQLGRANGE